MLRRFFAIFLLFPLAAHAGAGAAQTVYKCTGVDGRVAFQSDPCQAAGASQQAISVPPAGGKPAQAENQSWRLQAAQLEKRTAIRMGTEQGYPVPGMTLEELRLSLGAPNAVNASTARGSSDQYVYRLPKATYYVYVRDGLVDTVQTSVGYR
jgi:hypothetical protein